MAEPDWSDEHVSRANRFTLHILVAWVVLVVVSGTLAGTGSFRFVFVGVVMLVATWLLVHSLFAQVDELVRTRLGEADGLAGLPADGSENEGGESDG